MPVTKMSCNDWLGSWTTGYLEQAESDEKLNHSPPQYQGL